MINSRRSHIHERQAQHHKGLLIFWFVYGLVLLLIIKELVDYLNEFNLTELEYGASDTRIKVSKKIDAMIEQRYA